MTTMTLREKSEVIDTAILMTLVATCESAAIVGAMLGVVLARSATLLNTPLQTLQAGSTRHPPHARAGILTEHSATRRSVPILFAPIG